MDKIERQLELEQEMREAGVNRFLSRLNKTLGTSESVTPGARALMKRLIDRHSKAIKDWTDEVMSGMGKAHSIAGREFSKIKPEVVSYITLKILLDSLSMQTPFNATAIRIGKALEDEYVLQEYQRHNTGHFRAVLDRVKSSQSYHYKRTVLLHAMQQGLDFMPEGYPLPKSDSLHVGTKALELLRESTGVVEFQLSGRRKLSYYIFLTDEAKEFIMKVNDEMSTMYPIYMPMVVPPTDWISPTVGGYLTQVGIQLVKNYDKDYQEKLRHAEMSIPYEAINTIQQTPWAINQEVLEVATQLWSSAADVPVLPSRDDRTPSRCPLGPDETPDSVSDERLLEFKDWKKEAAYVYNDNIKQRSKRLLCARILQVAARFREETEIYFPHIYDFRGRVYPVPLFLNPQSNDLGRSLLRFSEGKALGTDGGVFWFLVHGANLYGYDKCSFDERVKYITDHSIIWKHIGENPYENREWMEADSPWQFLAWCLEYKDYLQQGTACVSHLPVQLDGSCNGLQHFSALLRDTEGGFAVNLVPSDHPQDVYRLVADEVRDKCMQHYLKDDEYAVVAKEWKDFGIDRSLTKRPTMIYAYSGTRVAMREYIEDYLFEEMEKRGMEAHPFSGGLFPATKFMADLVYDTIGEVVKGAADCMDWLKQVSAQAVKQGVDVGWTTPAGFPVKQRYRKQVGKQVKTVLNGKTTFLHVRLEKNDISKRKNTNGISPNFIHSLDAAALQIFIVKAKEQGIRDFAMVHDSYGTHACNIPLMAHLLREAFVSIYDGHNVCDNFRQQQIAAGLVDVPLPPELGDLELKAVMDSEYFFG